MTAVLVQGFARCRASGRALPQIRSAAAVVVAVVVSETIFVVVDAVVGDR